MSKRFCSPPLLVGSASQAKSQGQDQARYRRRTEGLLAPSGAGVSGGVCLSASGALSGPPCGAAPCSLSSALSWSHQQTGVGRPKRWAGPSSGTPENHLKASCFHAPPTWAHWHCLPEV